jgi:nicotinamidase-related amidase
MVVICLAPTVPTGTWQERVATPSMCTVQAPHWAMPQPYLVPVSRACRAAPRAMACCGQYAYAAIEPTKRLFAAARAAGLPIFYSTGDTRSESRPEFVGPLPNATNASIDPTDFAIRPEFKPQQGDVVITKQRASAFYGTPLTAHLTQLGVQTLIICGESTSGCVRAIRSRCLFARLSRRSRRGMLF